jgi:hypothetical protein
VSRDLIDDAVVVDCDEPLCFQSVLADNAAHDGWTYAYVGPVLKDYCPRHAAPTDTKRTP